MSYSERFRTKMAAAEHDEKIERWRSTLASVRRDNWQDNLDVSPRDLIDRLADLLGEVVDDLA